MAKKVRIVDLSVEIKEGLGDTSGMPPALQGLAEKLTAKIQYEDHKKSIPEMLAGFPGVKAEDLPEGLAWANEYVTMSTHSGTHIDSPYHFFPTSEGKRAKTIDEMPLELAYGDGVVLDVRHKKPGEVIGISDLQEALKEIKYSLKPLDIVLLMTGTDKFWDTLKYWTEYPGPGREATIWLVDQGIKVVGTDAPGWDRPFSYQVKEFQKTGNRKLIWEGHFAGIEREYYQIEKLAHLDQLPPFGFKFCCFPIKILRASAAWIRPVAIIEE